MSKHRPSRTNSRSTAALAIRMERKDKSEISRAAALRGISMSEYVRTVAVAQARRELDAARDGTIVLTPDEQLALWTASRKRTKATAAQRQLGAIMQGNA